jgi:hypothetical protein
MQKAVIETEHDSGFRTKIVIDNSTNFKDFSVEFAQHKVLVQIDNESNTITIGDCCLVGLEVQMFKDFINQIK